ncbi:trfA-like protein [Fusarium heterosporum]|uniref:TrfA-like protein n=1 Tax=Fusarium heterosporum TaxID=42747 RepID=A0A8H5TW67_FUSHE|nr:trfA-like protein [Fusarium heterosporum]
MARFSVPTTAKLPSSLRVDASNPAVLKSLNRLSRESLISLALDWLDDESLPNAVPYIEIRDDDEEETDDIYPPCQSVHELQQLYIDMRQQKGSKRDVVSRIIEGDWRIGLTLYQLAMADMAYFEQNPTSQKWTAYQILPLKKPTQDAGEDQVLRVDQASLTIPRFHPSTFLQNLQNHVLPDVKAHYHFHRPKDIPVLLLRIFVIDSPYNTDFALSSRDTTGTATNFDSSRTVYIAFPDGSPALYITKSQAIGPSGSGESKSLHSLIIDGVPKALSRPRERYTLKSGNLSSKNLDALLETKGSGGTNAAGGGWSIYSNESTKVSPLDTVLPTPPLSRESSLSNLNLKRGAPLTESQRAVKKAKLAARARFGDSGLVTDGKGVEKVDIVIQDPFPSTITDPSEAEDEETEEDDAATGSKNRRKSKITAVIQEANVTAEGDVENDTTSSDRWTPAVKVTFSGSHVWAGVRQLVEAGIVDGERMPGWMTGEEGVTTGLVRHGRIRGYKGSGI